MLKIGLTGGIGSGKTTVSDQFKKMGVPIIDTDIIAHDLLNHQPAMLEKIIAIFSDKVLNAKGAIDRKKLAQSVFSNKQQKQQLEKLLHPAIRKAVDEKIQVFKQQKSPPDYLLIVVPLLLETKLLETNFTDLTDRILVVIADQQLRVERIKQRDQRNVSQINAIINSQVNDDRRLSAADDVIENNQDLAHLTSQVKQLDSKYRQLF